MQASQEPDPPHQTLTPQQDTSGAQAALLEQLLRLSFKEPTRLPGSNVSLSSKPSYHTTPRKLGSGVPVTPAPVGKALWPQGHAADFPVPGDLTGVAGMKGGQVGVRVLSPQAPGQHHRETVPHHRRWPWAPVRPASGQKPWCQGRWSLSRRGGGGRGGGEAVILLEGLIQSGPELHYRHPIPTPATSRVPTALKRMREALQALP